MLHEQKPTENNTNIILGALRRMWGACRAHVGRMWGALGRGLILKAYLWTLEGDEVKRFYNRKKEEKKED